MYIRSHKAFVVGITHHNKKSSCRYLLSLHKSKNFNDKLDQCDYTFSNLYIALCKCDEFFFCIKSCTKSEQMKGGQNMDFRNRRCLFVI